MSKGIHLFCLLTGILGFFLFSPLNSHAEEIPNPVFPKALVVINAGEYTAVSVKQKPTAKSQTIGKFYGGLAAVEVITPGEEYTLIKGRDYSSKKMISGYVLNKSLKTVQTRYDWGVLVDLSKQKAYVYKDGNLEKSFLVSTGITSRGWRTPTGTYLIGSKGSSFTTETGVGAWNWVRFNKGYMFHSIIFDRNRKIIPSEAKKLGQEASHGCIRMPLDISVWFYENIPKNTPVIIVDSWKAPEIPIKVTINNENRNYTSPPLIVNQRVLVPMRNIFEDLGAGVTWNPVDKTITATKGSDTLILQLNTTKAILNGTEIQLSEAPTIIKGKTMVPVRFIAESLGVTVNWDRATKTVAIQD